MGLTLQGPQEGATMPFCSYCKSRKSQWKHPLIQKTEIDKEDTWQNSFRGSLSAS